MMNPLTWNREHQLGLLIAAAIGAALGDVLGYFVYAVGWGEGAVPFENWFWRPSFGALGWALFGAVIGGASVYVRCLMRAPLNSVASRPAPTRSGRPLPDWPAQDRLHDRPQDRSPRLPRSRS